MKNLVCKAKNKAQEMKTAMMAKDNGGKEIIVELGLAAIAVALLVVYRGQSNKLVTGILGEATTAINGLFTI